MVVVVVVVVVVVAVVVVVSAAVVVVVVVSSLVTFVSAVDVVVFFVVSGVVCAEVSVLGELSGVFAGAVLTRVSGAAALTALSVSGGSKVLSEAVVFADVFSVSSAEVTGADVSAAAEVCSSCLSSPRIAASTGSLSFSRFISSEFNIILITSSGISE